MNLMTIGAGSGGQNAATPYLYFDGINDIVNFGSDASLDNLHDNAFTAELWVRPDALTHISGILGKTNTFDVAGWGIVTLFGTDIGGSVKCATTSSTARFDVSAQVGTWMHVALTWDDAGDRKARLWIDGTLRNTASAGVGAVVSDAAQNLRFGNISSYFRGGIGWARLSNNVRYSAPFTPSARDTVPTVDGNTVELWAVDEGTGLTVAASVSSPTNDGAITGATWMAE